MMQCFLKSYKDQSLCNRVDKNYDFIIHYKIMTYYTIIPLLFPGKQAKQIKL